MHFASKLLLSIFVLTLCASQAAHATAKNYPYDCPNIDPKDGMRHIYNYQSSCSLRQAPEKIADCKKNVSDKETPFFDNIEKSLEKNCYNKNGYLRTSTCVWSHTWETTGPNAYWSYQTAKAFICYYK